MAKLLYQGHGSFRLTSLDGRVIFIDPAFGEGYDRAADLILVTHAHGDHNRLELIKQKENCRIITHRDALVGGEYKRFDLGGITVQAVEAGNKNHNPSECVGYIISVDGVKIYVSGDTSKTKTMEQLAAQNLDYALFCADGFYNMGLDEAAECAALVGAKNNIVIHLVPNGTALFDRKKADAWAAPNKLVVCDGEEIVL